MRAQAHLEVAIDFPEEDLPDDILNALVPQILGVHGEITQHLGDDRRGERLREGLSVAVIGPPNAGKSSLLNWLVRREAAIVSAVAGTTRDVIEVHLDLGGYPVTLADTAGLREARDEIEAEGVRRAIDRAGQADLRLVVLDATRWPALDREVRAQISRDAIVVANKIDWAALPPGAEIDGSAVLPVSVKTGAGLDELLASMGREVAQRLHASASPALTRERHRVALQDCDAALARAAQGLASGRLPELVAEDVRLAIRSLGRITGKVDVEDMLDLVFRDFCIGK